AGSCPAVSDSPALKLTVKTIGVSTGTLRTDTCAPKGQTGSVGENWTGSVVNTSPRSVPSASERLAPMSPLRSLLPSSTLSEQEARTANVAGVRPPG